MEFIGTFLGRLISLALFRQHMHQHRTVDFFRGLQDLDESGQIVTINGTQIGEAQLLENRGRHHQVLHATLQATQSL